LSVAATDGYIISNLEASLLTKPFHEDHTMVEELPDYEYVDEDIKQQDENVDGKKIQNPGTSVYTTGFKDMFLKAQLQRAIADCGFEHPSEVQQECIP
jgi:ATP-dependent RNA helicase UAP56/SUB2